MYSRWTANHPERTWSWKSSMQKPSTSLGSSPTRAAGEVASRTHPHQKYTTQIRQAPPPFPGVASSYQVGQVILARQHTLHAVPSHSKNTTLREDQDHGPEFVIFLVRLVLRFVRSDQPDTILRPPPPPVREEVHGRCPRPHPHPDRDTG